MILVALGSNLPHEDHGGPRETLEAVLDRLAQKGLSSRRRSRWFRSAPVPASDQPWFVNAVAELSTDLSPEKVLLKLHEVEAEFGRTRRTRNEARVVDLDLITYDNLVRHAPGEVDGREPDKADMRARPSVPHPRMRERAFVLYPLRDLAPDWIHPETGEHIDELIAGLPADQVVEPIEE